MWMGIGIVGLRAQGWERRLLLCARACGVLAVLLGLVILAGWGRDIQALRSVSVDWTSMQPLEALCFILSGAAMLPGATAPRLVRGALLLAVALIAASALWQCWTETTLGTDTLLYPDLVARQRLEYPGRMPEITAIEFLLFSAAMTLGHSRARQREFVVATTLGFTLAVTMLAGYLFGGTHDWSALGSYTSPAAPTTVGLVVLFMGAHLSQPRRGMAALLLSPRLGGMAARRILPFVVGMPLAVGLLIDAFTIGGARLHLALAVVLLMTVLAIMVAEIARQFEIADRDREAAMEALRRSEALFRATQEASLFGTVVLDAVRDESGRITDFKHAYVNPTALKLMGVAATDPAASALLSRCPAHADGALVRRYIDVVETGQPMDREFQSHKGGRIRWFRTLAVKLDGGVAVSFFEITEQKMSERALARAEARYRAVVDTAVDAMVVVDEADVIQSFNRAAERIFATTAAEAVGRPASMLYARSAVRVGEVIGMRREVDGLRRDGTVFPLDLSVAEWFDGGRRFLTAIMRDVTQRRLVENALQDATRQAETAKEQADRANAAKSTFLAAPSHDLRQPIQAMALLSEVLSHRLQGHPASQVVGRMQAALDALRMLLDGLLDVSRLDAGVVKANPQPVAIGGVVARLAQEYALRARSNGIELRTVASSAWGRTDPVLLERILRNLLENALRYTDRGKILLGCRRRMGTVRVYVCDTGIGIAADHRTAIFQEFFQVGNSERDREKGLGLGLAIVKRLTAMLGHHLAVASQPGRGSCFTIDLALAAPPADGEVTAPGRAERPRHPGTVLVIDDEMLVREGLATLLQDWGYEVLEAEDEVEAVRWVTERERCPTLILADYRLRDEHLGTDAVEEVRLACHGDPPAIILTGDTAPERLAEAAASGFLIAHKPVEPERLKALMAEARR